jgi:hypothetical protein
MRVCILTYVHMNIYLPQDKKDPALIQWKKLFEYGTLYMCTCIDIYIHMYMCIYVYVY